MNGGALSALSINNKPDELEEALQYYCMKASCQAHSQPDIHAAFTLESFYHYGIRGARQGIKLALKYYEIAEVGKLQIRQENSIYGVLG
eukprot:14268893-Ditylum_brightwellii.AAC.1